MDYLAMSVCLKIILRLAICNRGRTREIALRRAKNFLTALSQLQCRGNGKVEKGWVEVEVEVRMWQWKLQKVKSSCVLV